MTRIHSIYNRMLYGILLLGVACGMGTSCADDYFSEGESSGRMATLHVQFPKAGTSADSQVTSARFIAFEAGGSGVSGRLLVNSGITPDNARVLIPVGRSNIYIIANAPSSLGLDTITTEKSLKATTATWAEAKFLPHIMVGSYHNVSIEQTGVKDAEGNSITVGKDVQRIVAKLTVSLQYKSQGGNDIVIDSVTVKNRASYSSLLARAFDGSSYVPTATDRVESLTETGTTDNTTTYIPLEFYLSEYLVDDDHKSNSACLFIHAHQGTTVLKYPVYIGDWFDTGVSYDEFGHADTPAALVGITGLSVTRNKHYKLACNLKGELTNLKTSVEEWTVVDITGDINTPYINFERTEVMVNPLSEQGTSVAYTSSMPKENISVEFTENPDSRFSCTVTDKSINFIHKDRVSRITDTSGKYLTGKAIVTARDGSTTFKTEILLGVFNPLSKFYVRGGAISYDYGSLSPATARSTSWKTTWSLASGYSNPYKGIVSTLVGKNPNLTYMNAAIADQTSGCGGYWEGSKENPQTGIGCWRLPSRSEALRMLPLLYFSHENLVELGCDDVDIYYNGLSVDIMTMWTSDEDGTEAASVVHYFKDSDRAEAVSMRKSVEYYIRCVRNIDNTSVSGGSSYLLVSHNTYEVSPLSFRTTPGVVPIYYESDGPVSVSLIDENGNDISNKGVGMPFVGFSSGNEDALFRYVENAEWSSAGEPPIVFPNKSYSPTTKGYFCLHSTVRAAQEYFTSLGDLKGSKISDTRKSKYTLLFRSGTLSKSVPISIVNPLATVNVGSMSLEDAMGISHDYAGYDYWQKRVITSSKIDAIELNMPVSDRFDVGCGKYYEGSPTDPQTGVGNWFVAPTIIAVAGAMATNRDRWGYAFNPTAANYNDMYGEGLNFTSTDIQYNKSFWTTRSVTDKKMQSTVAMYIGSASNAVKSSSQIVRCERRLNADILTLSTQSLSLSPGQSADILYYTDVKGVSFQVLSLGDNSAFTTTTTTTGRIKVNCKAGSASGSEANLLVETVGGMSKRSKTYKIVKLKVK